MSRAAPAPARGRRRATRKGSMDSTGSGGAELVPLSARMARVMLDDEAAQGDMDDAASIVSSDENVRRLRRSLSISAAAAASPSPRIPSSSAAALACWSTWLGAAWHELRVALCGARLALGVSSDDVIASSVAGSLRHQGKMKPGETWPLWVRKLLRYSHVAGASSSSFSSSSHASSSSDMPALEWDCSDDDDDDDGASSMVVTPRSLLLSSPWEMTEEQAKAARDHQQVDRDEDEGSPLASVCPSRASSTRRGLSSASMRRFISQPLPPLRCAGEVLALCSALESTTATINSARDFAGVAVAGHATQPLPSPATTASSRVAEQQQAAVMAVDKTAPGDYISLHDLLGIPPPDAGAATSEPALSDIAEEGAFFFAAAVLGFKQGRQGRNRSRSSIFNLFARNSDAI